MEWVYRKRENDDWDTIMSHTESVPLTRQTVATPGEKLSDVMTAAIFCALGYLMCSELRHILVTTS